MAPTGIDSTSMLSVSEVNKTLTFVSDSLRKHCTTPPTSDRQGRTSFASFKEDRKAVAQSFIDSKVSPFVSASEEAIDDSTSQQSKDSEPGLHRSVESLAMPVTNPHSVLHGFICPCDGFRGWKQISVSGKTASKSFGDLRIFSRGFTWDCATKNRYQMKKAPYPSGEAPFERLPVELLDSIIGQLVVDIPPNGFKPRNIDLMSLLLTSRALHSATLTTLYNRITIPHSNVFRKFLENIVAHPVLGTIVRRLDFSHFNPTGAGMTARERAETQNLTHKTLLQCLNLLPDLREFLAQEHIDEDLSADVLRKLFEMPHLQALDFCACSSTPFRDAMMSVFRSPRAMDLPQTSSITRLSLHECTILPSAIFESLLPRFPKLTHLDLTHTRVTNEALASIPRTARISHLNLSKCSSLSGDKVVEFLSGHPAVKSLVYLNLLMDAKSHEMLSAVDITALLSILPATLRSLNLKGSKMSQNHVPLFLPLTKHVEELCVGRNLSYQDIVSLFWPSTEGSGEQKTPWIHHSLRYLDISDLEANQLDLALVFGSTTSFLKPQYLPLEVIEVSQTIFDKFKAREHIFKQFGWVVKEAGRRGWLVRDMNKLKLSGDLKIKTDDGSRKWKMGATHWGMRKVPVAYADVGGMYGLYMFKR